jgi:hypothetical protein
MAMISSKVAALGVLSIYFYILIKLSHKGEYLSSFQFKTHLLQDRSQLSHLQIYIYDWNSSITNQWPVSFSHHRLFVLPHYRENHGTGKLLNSDIGLHATHQYSLFTIFLSALRASPFVTKNPAEASFFFIPYDLGMDSSARKSDGALTATNCPTLPTVFDHLRSSPYFQRSGGKDHIVIHSINQPMTFFVNKHCRKFYEFCSNCIKLSIDTYPSSLFGFLDSLPYMMNNWISIPFPANFHLSSHVSKPPWRTIVDNSKYFPEMYLSERPNKLCFMGSKEVTAKRQRLLRSLLINECLQLGAPSCWLKELTSHSSNQYVSDNEMIGEVNPYSQCRLCLCPGGDFPTRKAVLDALLSGCIPVIFEREAAWTQWPWHWGNSSIAKRAIVYIDRAPLLRQLEVSSSAHPSSPNNSSSSILLGQDIQSAIAALLRMSDDLEEIKQRLYTIAAVGERLQYSIPHDPPKTQSKDAFAVIMEHLAMIRDDHYRVQ